ncbi:general transcription factor 3C polypeptide [Nesidiocoris tenuis]|nr:general transcription factor 3C polypeptide [Nesidiocoris tenuis]
MGSCPLYSERVDITTSVRRTKLQEACETWGEKLVMVANQKTRLRVLTEPETNELVEFTSKNFCFLERVGRSRQHGEITQGKNGLQVITEDSKTLFYYKKVLNKQKLIKQQVFNLKNHHVKRGSSVSNGLIIHLTKYAREIKSKYAAASEKASRFIGARPEKYALYNDVANLFSDRIDLKKLIMREPKRFKTEMIPYKKLYPYSSPCEWKTKATSVEKTVRVIRLLDTNDDDEDEDDEDDVEAGTGFLHPQIQKLGVSLARQCYELIERSGPQGLSQLSISQVLGLSNLHARALVRYLSKKEYVATTTVDKGRQRAIHYLSKKFERSQQSILTEFEKEKDQLMKLLSPPAKKIKLEPNVPTTPLLPISAPEPARNVLSQEEMDEIQVTVTMSEFKPPPDQVHSLLQNMYQEGPASLVTTRLIKRVQMIIKAVNTFKVIHDPHKLQRLIYEEEEKEGHKYVVDRRSVARILDKLVADGLVRIMKIKLEGYGRLKMLQFIVHPSVTAEDSLIKSAIEQAKMKLPIITKESIKRENRLMKHLGSPTPTSFDLGTYNSKAGRKYGLKPKFVKKQVLHSFMFYLAYGHEGREATADEVRDYLISKNQDPEIAKELTTIYSTTSDWKTFVPPVPDHKEYSRGWILVSDLLVRLPLSLFLSIVNVPYEIPGLLDYLDHPVKKYFLVRSLPPDIASKLTLHRKYIFVISDIIQKLAFMGLVQLGPQKLREKDQYFVFVNRNALLKDTTPSPSGYNHISSSMTYEIMPYKFNSLEDVEQYWYDLWNFAMNTNLGCRNVMTGKPVVIESVCTKKILLESIAPRQTKEAYEKDVGYLPGDHLGAAGLDSDLFAHLKRNWYYPSEGKLEATTHKAAEHHKTAKRVGRKREPPKSDDAPRGFKKIRLVAPKASKAADQEQSEVDVDDMPLSERAIRVERSVVSPVAEVTSKTKAKHKKITRFLKPKQFKTPRRPYYDQVDREALRRMVKLRVDWSSNEDNLLLICKVATLYMSADSRRHVAKNFALVREILHSTYPQLSQNKTSRACQRRMCYMMKNPSTTHSVYLCLEEIKQDSEITDKFGMAVEKLDRVVKALGKGPKACQAEYDKIYKDLVNCLIGKLKTIALPDEATLENVCIPDTVDEFKSKYNVVTPKNMAFRYGSFSEVQNIVDIMCSVVNVVIHSSLCCAYDKASYSYQLFYVYQQYPDKLLRSVIARCRSMQIVSCRKRYKRWKTLNNSCLPLGASPYQLSITYINIMQTRYQYGIFSNSRSHWQSMMTQLKIQKENLVDSPSSSKNPICSSEIEIKVTLGGECANVVEMFSAGFLKLRVAFPVHLIVLDPRLSDKEDSYNLIMKRFEELLKMIHKNADDGDDEADEDGALSAKHRLPLDNDKLHEEFNLSNKSGVANTASRLALYMMRDEPIENLEDGTQHAHDYFVLKPCKIKVTLDEEKSREEIASIVKKSKQIVEDVKRMAVISEENVETADAMERLEDENANLQTLKSILDFVETKKELGAFFNEIVNHVPAPIQEIAQCLHLLIDKHFILRTGHVRLRFVHNKHKKPWVVRSCFITRLQREKLPSSSATNVSLAFRLTNSDATAKSDAGESSRENAEIAETSNDTASKNGTADDSKLTTKGTDEDASDSQNDSAAGTSSKPAEPVVMVLRNHKKRWTTLKEKKFSDVDFSLMKPVVVCIRPWIRIDGTLNRLVLDRALGSVLGHCLSSAGIFIKKLQDRFTPALQPAHTYELVLMLEKLGVVKLQKELQSKPSLISRRRPHTFEPALGFEDAEIISVHTELMAITIFGQFIADGSVGRDYLEALTDARLLSHS